MTAHCLLQLLYKLTSFFDLFLSISTRHKTDEQMQSVNDTLVDVQYAPLELSDVPESGLLTPNNITYVICKDMGNKQEIVFHLICNSLPQKQSFKINFSSSINALIICLKANSGVVICRISLSIALLFDSQL